MKRWSLQKTAPLTVQQFVDKCFGDDVHFVTQFHNIRGDSNLEVGSWAPAPTGVDQPNSTAKPRERHDVRQLSSRAPLQAPVVVQRMLGNVEEAVVLVDQVRTVEAMEDDSLASVRVEQSIQLEGLPLDDAYTMRTVTSAIPAAQQRAQEMVGDASRMITITVMGEIECSSGASATGLKGVIEGILYSQSREASVLFLDLLTMEGAISATPADTRSFQGEQQHTSGTHDTALAHDTAPTSDDGDDVSRASSDFSWDSARSWMSNGHQAEQMSENELRDQLRFLIQLKEDGLIHRDVLTAQQRALLRNYHSIPSPTRGSSASEVVPAGDFYSQTQYAGGDRAQNLSRRETNGVDLEGGYGGRSRKTTMDMLGLTFGKHAKRGITSWFVIAGVLHFALDGIFVIFGNSENMTSEWMAPWRVYAQEDERYSRRSSLINAVQVLGAFVHGPLCFVAGWGIHRQRNWYPIVAILVSFCELYNRVILISTFDSLSTKLDNPSPQFLFAFVTWNLLWIVIPAVLLFFLVKTLLVSDQMQTAERHEATYRRAGKEKRRVHKPRPTRKHRP